MNQLPSIDNNNLDSNNTDTNNNTDAQSTTVTDANSTGITINNTNENPIITTTTIISNDDSIPLIDSTRIRSTISVQNISNSIAIVLSDYNPSIEEQLQNCIAIQRDDLITVQIINNNSNYGWLYCLANSGRIIGSTGSEGYIPAVYIKLLAPRPADNDSENQNNNNNSNLSNNNNIIPVYPSISAPNSIIVHSPINSFIYPNPHPLALLLRNSLADPNSPNYNRKEPPTVPIKKRPQLQQQQQHLHQSTQIQSLRPVSTILSSSLGSNSSVLLTDSNEFISTSSSSPGPALPGKRRATATSYINSINGSNYSANSVKNRISDPPIAYNNTIPQQQLSATQPLPTSISAVAAATTAVPISTTITVPLSELIADFTINSNSDINIAIDTADTDTDTDTVAVTRSRS